MVSRMARTSPAHLSAMPSLLRSVALLAAASSLALVNAQFIDVESPTWIVTPDNPHRLQQSANPATTLDLPMNYMFEFNLTVGTVVRNTWQSILHVTATGNNCCSNGDRIPGLWWRPNTRRFYLTDSQNVGSNDDECNAAANVNMAAGTTYLVRIELLSTQTRLFINGNLACAETRNGRRPYSNALVYMSDPWHAAADATITGMIFQPSTVAGNYQNYNVIGPNFVQLQRGYAAGAVDIPPNYQISFDIRPSSTTVGNWGNILHVTGTGGDCCGYGSRIPGIWFRPNTRNLYLIDGHFTFANSGGANAGDDECPNIPTLPAGQTSNLRIVMNTSSVFVYLNGRQVCTEARNDRRMWTAAQVWVSDPWYPTANAQMANLTITNLDYVPPPPTTLAPPVATNAQMIVQLSTAQASIAAAAASLVTAYSVEQSQIAQLQQATAASTLTAMQTQLSALSAAISTEASQLSQMTTTSVSGQISTAISMQNQIMSQQSAAMSSSVAQLSSAQSTLRSTIVASVSALPLGGGSATTVGPQVYTDVQGIHVSGGGSPVSLEGECGAVNPCGILTALNALRQL